MTAPAPKTFPSYETIRERILEMFAEEGYVFEPSGDAEDDEKRRAEMDALLTEAAETAYENAEDLFWNAVRIAVSVSLEEE